MRNIYTMEPIIQPAHSPGTRRRLIKQAIKIRMLNRICRNLVCGRNAGYACKNQTTMFKRHQCGLKDFSPRNITCGVATNTWLVMEDGVPNEGFLITYVIGTDSKCDCVDYPAEYVCRDCEICIHMYTCSCAEVDQFPSLICRHIHAVLK